jgi:MoxR-like ATPase
MDKFDDFVFSDALADELEIFDKHPEVVGRGALLFHGLPGTGKTSFAKYFAKKHAHNVRYVDINDDGDEFIKTGWKSGKGQKISGWAEYFGNTFDKHFEGAEEKYFDHALIMDEWNDADRKKQNKWKVAFEQMYDLQSIKILIIICMNTTHAGDTAVTDDKKNKLTKKEIDERDKDKLEKKLSPAIKSRCTVIEFSPYADEEEEILDKFRERYPKLTERQLERTYPDLRSLVRLGERSIKFN